MFPAETRLFLILTLSETRLSILKAIEKQYHHHPAVSHILRLVRLPGEYHNCVLPYMHATESITRERSRDTEAPDVRVGAGVSALYDYNSYINHSPGIRVSPYLVDTVFYGDISYTNRLPGMLVSPY